MADRKPLLSASAIILLVIVGTVASGLPFVIIQDGSLIAASAGIAVSKATEQVLQQGALVAAPLLFDLEFNGNRIHSVLRIMLLLSLIVSNVIKLVMVYCADFMYAPLLSLLGESLLPIGAGSAVLVYVSHFHKDKLTSFEVILAYMALIASRVLKGLQIVYPEWSLIYDIFLYSLFFGIALVVCLIATISFNADSKQYRKFDSLYLFTPLLWLVMSVLVPLYVNGSLRHDLQSTTSHNLCNAMNVVFTLVLVIASRKFGTRDGSSEKTETKNELTEVETRQSQSTQEGSSHHHVARRDSPVVQVSKRHTREQQNQNIPKEGNAAASGGSVSKARVWNSLSEAGTTIKVPQANSCFVDRKKIDAEQPHNSRSNVLQVTEMFEPGNGTANNTVALPPSFPLMEVPVKSESAATTATHATTVFPAVPLTPLEVRPAAPRLVSRPSPPSSSNSPFPPPSSSSGGAVHKATPPPSAAVSSSNPSSTIATSTVSAASLVLTPLRAPPEVLKASPARLSVSASLAAARDRAVTPTRRQHHIETAGETVVTPLSSPKEDYVRSLTVVSVMQNLVQKVVTASAPNRRSSKVAAEEAEAVRSQLNPKPSMAPPNLKKISPIVASSTANGSGYTPLLHSHDVLDVQDEVVLLEHQALVAEELKNKKDQIRQRRAAAAAAAATNNGQKK